MTAAAEAGRGTHVFISDLALVEERMEQLFKKIETPAMTDLSLTVDGYTGAEIWPNPLPDLYAGDPVLATIRADTKKATRMIPALRLNGTRGDEAWSKRVLISAAETRPGVSKLWARQRIKALEAFRLSPEASAPGAWEAIDAEILETALDHGLVSRLTSLVAVDVTPSRPRQLGVVTRDVPLNLPKGWDPTAFFNAEGTVPNLAPEPAEMQIIEASLQRLQAAAATRAAAAAGARVPQGATGWVLQAALGLAMLIAGALGWRRSRRGRRWA